MITCLSVLETGVTRELYSHQDFQSILDNQFLYPDLLKSSTIGIISSINCLSVITQVSSDNLIASFVSEPNTWEWEQEAKALPVTSVSYIRRLDTSEIKLILDVDWLRPEKIITNIERTNANLKPLGVCNQSINLNDYNQSLLSFSLDWHYRTYGNFCQFIYDFIRISLELDDELSLNSFFAVKAYRSIFQAIFVVNYKNLYLNIPSKNDFDKLVKTPPEKEFRFLY